VLNLSLPLPISGDYDFNEFDCGESSLNDWLKNRALKNQASGTSRCFILCNGKKVIGYYCLSAGAISRESAPKSLQRNMPDPLPVLLLGRLAIDLNYQNHGLGNALLRDAMLRAAHVSGYAGIVAILVHALSEQAKKYYLSRGFVQSPLQSMTLMMTLATVRQILLETD